MGVIKHKHELQLEMEFVHKDKFMYTSNSCLYPTCDPNEDRVSFSEKIVFGLRNSYRVWHPLSSNSSMMLDHTSFLTFVHICLLTQNVAAV